MKSIKEAVEKGKCKHLDILPIIKGTIFLGTGDISTTYYCRKCKKELGIDDL